MASEASSSRSGSRGRGESLVMDCGRCKSSCGYCKSPGRTSITHGLWANSLTVDDYQDLIDRGWRRSGCFLYKPEMERSCCPSYTIRLKASDFLPSKEQARVLKKMQRFLDGTLDGRKSTGVEDANVSKGTCSCTCHETSTSGTKRSFSDKVEMNGAESMTDYLSYQVNNAVGSCVGSGMFPQEIQFPKATVKKVSEGKRKKLVEGAENLICSCNIAFQIAATIRRFQQAKGEASHCSENSGLSPQVIAEKLVGSMRELMVYNDMTIKACNGHINFYSTTLQASVSEDSPTAKRSKSSADGCKRKGCCLERNSKSPEGKKQRLVIRLNRSHFDPEEFALYKRYQMQVHNDKPEQVTESSYRRFLIETPLVFVPPSGDGRVPSCGFGSFHQQYLIDDKLVAVGVVDILPRCLSSKYLFWDPDYAFLSLGKFSALQEVGWVKENQVYCPSLQYYYMGYYIHSCSKMRYKAAYRPSELLCPLRYQWVSYDVARQLLDQQKYVVLSDIPLSQNVKSLPSLASEDAVQVEHDDNNSGESHDMMVHDEEMGEPKDDSSDEESDSESGDLTSDETKISNVGHTLIGLKESSVRYRDLRRALSPIQREYLEKLESQLHSYKKVVGTELSERMVYSLE